MNETSGKRDSRHPAPRGIASLAVICALAVGGCVAVSLGRSLDRAGLHFLLRNPPGTPEAELFRREGQPGRTLERCPPGSEATRTRVVSDGYRPPIPVPAGARVHVYSRAWFQLVVCIGEDDRVAFVCLQES